jgi:hypothetical protein
MFLAVSFTLDPSTWPDWVVPTLGGVMLLFLLVLVLWMFKGGDDNHPPSGASWHQTPVLRTFERQQYARADGTGDGRDKRVGVRRGGQPVDVLISDAELRSTPTHGMVIDRSMRGLCIAVEEGHDVKSVLSVRPANASASVPWVRIQVKNCRHVGNGWEIGCEFVQTPPASILMLFG